MCGSRLRESAAYNTDTWVKVSVRSPPERMCRSHGAYSAALNTLAERSDAREVDRREREDSEIEMLS